MNEPLKLLFTDLDDTLFQSHRKRVPHETCRPCAFLSDGEAISYASIKEQGVLNWFLRDSVVIPVTARNMNAFSRVAINFQAEAVINYGGIILDAQRKPDAVWLENSANHAAMSAANLKRWSDVLRLECARRSVDVSVRIIEDFGINFYVVVKSRTNDLGVIASLASYCRRLLITQATNELEEVHIHHNGNNLALLPMWLDKKQAVAHLQEKYRKANPLLVTFGAGDSLVDISFMQSCDYLITPSGSQIDRERMGVVR